VRPEDNWVRLLEDDLRRDHGDVRTVNCGGAGAVVADEYAWALEHRFAMFQPDVVIVTFCLNDLIPSSSALAHMRQAPHTPSVILNRLLAAFGPSPLDLDPSVDWVGLLMALPKETPPPFYSEDAPYDAMWAQGTPQRALLSMQTFCRARNIQLLVTVWPFLQGLGPGQFYPFARIHELVAQWCREQADPIPCLDLLPVLKGNRPEDLWVTPSDMHPNPHAHRVAAPAIAAFVRPFLSR
jgi:lysophospholipase L1-like esterase